MFNKGLDESDKKEGLLERLKNIEGKNEQQLGAIKDQGERQLFLPLQTFSTYTTPGSRLTKP